MSRRKQFANSNITGSCLGDYPIIFSAYKTGLNPTGANSSGIFHYDQDNNVFRILKDTNNIDPKTWRHDCCMWGNKIYIKSVSPLPGTASFFGWIIEEYVIDYSTCSVKKSRDIPIVNTGPFYGVAQGLVKSVPNVTSNINNPIINNINQFATNIVPNTFLQFQNGMEMIDENTIVVGNTRVFNSNIASVSNFINPNENWLVKININPNNPTIQYSSTQTAPLGSAELFLKYYDDTDINKSESGPNKIPRDGDVVDILYLRDKDEFLVTISGRNAANSARGVYHFNNSGNLIDFFSFRGGLGLYKTPKKYTIRGTKLKTDIFTTGFRVNDFTGSGAERAVSAAPNGNRDILPVTLNPLTVHPEFASTTLEIFGAAYNAKPQLTPYEPTPCYKIGDIGPCGGLIFAVPNTGNNQSNFYYEVALEDINNEDYTFTNDADYPINTDQGCGITSGNLALGGSEWGAFNRQIITSTKFGDGLDNTIDINGVQQTLFPQNPTHPVIDTHFIAATQSLNYTACKGDWYLPSLDEFKEIMNNVGPGTPFNNTLNLKDNIPSNTSDLYWTSSSYDNSISANSFGGGVLISTAVLGPRIFVNTASLSAGLSFSDFTVGSVVSSPGVLPNNTTIVSVNNFNNSGVAIQIELSNNFITTPTVGGSLFPFVLNPAFAQSQVDKYAYAFDATQNIGVPIFRCHALSVRPIRRFTCEDNVSETGPFELQGYYPLYDTIEGAENASPNSSGYHIHKLEGTDAVEYYMPNGLQFGTTQFHGDYPGPDKTVIAPINAVNPVLPSDVSDEPEQVTPIVTQQEQDQQEDTYTPPAPTSSSGSSSGGSSGGGY